MSGGPDSLALLILAHAALPEGGFAVATVDHGLRPESAAEAAHVAGICGELGIAHTTLSIAMDRGSAMQERARDARYQALAHWCRATGLAALVTAHHADDQAETLIMRLNRGAGLRGLAAMRPIAQVPGDTLPLLRPLLGWARASLADVVDYAGLVAIDDPSNRDIRFERARLRTQLAGAPWLDRQGLAASTAHLAEADVALDWAAAAVPIGEADGGLALEPDLPRALALRVLERVIARLGGSTPRGRDLARWHDRLAAGDVATLGRVRGDGRAKPWRFTLAPPHRSL
ncbi:tRNA lysidine(34) synthetase TilS [Novosphingobium sp.]|uniref:tRNA lysidine(34) synthetase TilS n=1 Tax=Novosphingobium sp. TaxID=1874826 RepID=UPI003D0BD4AE